MIPSKTHILTFGVMINSLIIATSTATEKFPRSVTRDDISVTDAQRVQTVTRNTQTFQEAEQFEASQGGAGTSRKIINRNAFSHSSANITFEQEEAFKLGNALFRKLWVSSPSSTHSSDGLGPLFNARACQSCHLKDGRGHPPEGGKDFISMLFRLARPAVSEKEIEALKDYAALNIPDPVYGGQLQDLAVPGLPAEGKISISYKEEQIALSDGETVYLRKPTYKIMDLGYGPLHEQTTVSPRIAPPMIGLGLIEAIHPADIIKNADPADENHDGISGKISMVQGKDGEPVLGRFGWKASQPTLRSQNAAAFAGDIGISSEDNPNHYGDCTSMQNACLERANGVQKRLGTTEAPSPILELVTFYSSNLAVPARRNVSKADVLRGKELFYEAGCVACHRPKFVTSRNGKHKEHQFQLIWPYSDFLLHDMGPGLADNQPVGMANGQEWRTPPLWGIGLTETVNGHTFFLHDGRARNLTEAILWHGGEAKGARDRFSAMPKSDRANLIRFLESL